ncbi:hypothetical protein [Ensifer sp. SSB1]|jgi:hypothetical protein|uniref:hypothetical protein n=1 Tax=Ensifer sp. SSB1 TaxID=2795385 RepID=UPI001A43C962|nr:hypothetical protein [Ensifer sp. SSB1]MBK5571607.1 hypothetical protein [Ensifer sp. SSB1]
MKELESGFDRTLLPLPTETVFLKSSEPLSGRYVPFEADPHDEDDYTGLPSIPWLWQPTEEATPSRWYAARTKGYSRGTITNPKTRKAISYSSTYEMNLAYMLCASRHISLVEDQPSAIPVICEDGDKRHTIDYRTTMLASRNRIVVAVRPSSLLEKDGLPDTIGSVNLGSLNGFADEAIILTDKEITDARGWNGKSVLRALKSPVTDDNERLRDFASKFHGTVSLRTLTADFEDRAAAENAIWCLVHDEVLIPVRPDLRLIDAPFVRFNHNH